MCCFVRCEIMEMEFLCGDEVMFFCGVGGWSYLGNLYYVIFYVVCQQVIVDEIDYYIWIIDFMIVVNGFLFFIEEM